MIIVDLQQTMIANIMINLGHNAQIELPMFKHMVLNSIRSYRQKFSSTYGELVIATDTGTSWRRRVFPYYKASRKKDRDESSLDWDGIFEGLNAIKHDLREYFPYRLIEIDTAEADDIIGTLCHEFGSDIPGSQRILILSADKDFKQLQTYMNVDQYDPTRNKKVTENSPDNYLLEHIIKGDRGDGIPNILSEDNCLVIGQRQNTMTKNRLAALKNNDFSISPIAERNFARNKQLIDLKHTPQHLRQEILQSYHSQDGKGREKIFNYLIKNRMKHLMEYINEF